jgi:primosomal protein N' (replication factor Y)
MPDPAQYASVAVPAPLRSTFQYRIPAGMDIAPGNRVLVPFGQRKLVAIVISLDDALVVESARVKEVLQVYSIEASITVPIIRLCEWAATYYEHPIGEVFAAAMPAIVRSGWNPDEPEEQLCITSEGLAVTDSELKQAPAQRRALAFIGEFHRTRDDLKSADIRTQTIKALVDKGWANWLEVILPRREDFHLAGVAVPDIEVTNEQSTAINSIGPSGTYLLQGVTGSGKTEVYLRVIEPVLRAGKQVLVLVPEIGLTPQTIARFSERFDVPVTVLHSGLNDRERALGWMQARDGNAGIILGTRSAVFTPLKRPGAIIVDEEHDVSYKQQDGFRYSARDLAVLRGHFEDVPVILGSATPSLESLHNVETDKYVSLQLRTRPPGTVAETYELLDTRHLETRNGFTRSLRNRIRSQLDKGEQVLVFLNRRGFAPVMMCNDCDWIAHCRRCDAKLTYHLNLNTLVCHHCGTMSHNIISCQSCGSSHVSAIGLGTQRIEQTLKEMYPDVPVLRIDRDSTRKKGAMAGFLEQISAGEPAILVGTQLLSKGHHFPNVTLVALLDIDAGFYSADFRAIERLGQLVLQVGGRSGRAEKPGTVILQTEFATHPLLTTLVEQGYTEFARAIMKEREEMDLPPYSFTALFRAEANDGTLAKSFLEALASGKKSNPSVNLLGPIPALMEKKAGRYRQILMLNADHRPHLHQELRARISIAESLPQSKKVRWSVDVDPVDIF